MIGHSVATAPHERRDATRLPIATRVEAFDRDVDHRTAGDVATLLDLSKDGAALLHSASFAIGALVRLYIPAVGWRHVEIRWLADDQAGGRFLLPLLDHEFRAALASGRRPSARRAGAGAAGSRAHAVAGWLARWGERLAMRRPHSIRIAGRATLARLR